MKYTTGTGQKLNVHDKCLSSKFCTIHNPSMTWPTNWRDDWGLMEYICPCGVGYPAPEDKGGEGHAFGCCGNSDCINMYREAKRSCDQGAV